MLRKIRVTLGILVLLAVTLLFVDLTGALHHWLGWIAKIQFLPALLALDAGVLIALLALTLLFGRIYCSVVCPLGLLQDAISHVRGWFWHKKRGRFSYSAGSKRLRVAVLLLTLICWGTGLNAVVSLLAPYSAYGRIATHLLRPLWALGNNALAALAARYDSYAFYSVDVWLKSLPTLLIAVITLLVVGTLAWLGGRTYCNNICPVGAVLSLFARHSVLKVRFDASRCKHCGQCASHCKSSCIDYRHHTVNYSRCVACGNCLTHCKFNALHYTTARSATAPAPPDKQRRAFLSGTVSLIALCALAQERKKVDGGLALIEDKQAPARQTPLTPPGSISATHLARHCTACQLCIAQCPNQVLRPSSSLTRFMQPQMSYERGFCRPECTRCSQVCPTGAILPLTPAEKSATRIGHAVWIAQNCVCVSDRVDCGNCERHCPTGAITMVPLDAADDSSPFVPAIDTARCIGCGKCEYVCPARPFSAIYIEGHTMHHTL